MKTLPLPMNLVKTHSSDILGMDYLYVQGIPFHQSISSSYKFRTIEALKEKKKPNREDGKAQSKRATNVYHAREIAVEQVNIDNKFEALTEELRSISVNMVEAGEHVGNIEWSNRSVKERTRCHVHRLPYRIYPIEMVCGCITKVVTDLNIEVADDGLSLVMSLGKIVTGRVNPSYKEV